MSAAEQHAAKSAAARQGVAMALGGYTVWGFYALFFKQLEHVNPLEVVAHRAFWSIPIAGVVLLALGRTADIARSFRDPKILRLLCLTTFLVTVTWGLFVWAIAVDRTLETSLGFYINPLLNVVIGFTLLGERFTGAQKLAVVLAVAGVAILIVAAGVFPWVAFTLGGCFATYGYLRKTIDVGPAQGFFVETILLSVIGVAIVVWLSSRGEVHFLNATSDTWWLIACGPMTATPLILFATAARRLRFSTLGLLQYIAPTGLFLTAVFVFDEPVGLWRAITFVLIWTALAIYSFEAIRLDRETAAIGL